MIRHEQGVSPYRVIVDERAPLFHVRSDSPPIFLMAGSHEGEIPGRRAEVELLEAMLRQAGHPHVVACYDNSAHHEETASLACLAYRRHLDFHRKAW